MLLVWRSWYPLEQGCNLQISMNINTNCYLDKESKGIRNNALKDKDYVESELLIYGDEEAVSEIAKLGNELESDRADNVWFLWGGRFPNPA